MYKGTSSIATAIMITRTCGVHDDAKLIYLTRGCPCAIPLLNSLECL